MKKTMVNKIKDLKNIFYKGDGESHIELPDEESTTFLLKVDDLVVGELFCQEGNWYFKYTEEFKEHSDEYYRIIGFPDLDKVYENNQLWPFFRVRIPGLKQPHIQEIIINEELDPENEVELLKRFGKKTPANPYELVEDSEE